MENDLVDMETNKEMKEIRDQFVVALGLNESSRMIADLIQNAKNTFKLNKGD